MLSGFPVTAVNPLFFMRAHHYLQDSAAFTEGILSLKGIIPPQRSEASSDRISGQIRRLVQIKFQLRYKLRKSLSQESPGNCPQSHN